MQTCTHTRGGHQSQCLTPPPPCQIIHARCICAFTRDRISKSAKLRYTIIDYKPKRQNFHHVGGGRPTRLRCVSYQVPYIKNTVWENMPARPTQGGVTSTHPLTCSSPLPQGGENPKTALGRDPVRLEPKMRQHTQASWGGHKLEN